MATKTTKSPTEGTNEPKTKVVTKIVVTAPGGPRRRAGYSFSPAETTFTQADLGENAEDLITAWRNDPFLKIDTREFEEPDTEEQPSAANE